MPDFIWTDAPLEQRFQRKFPIAGNPEWQDGLGRGIRNNRLDARWIHEIRSARPTGPPSCPRVFISHRQIDEKPALRVAWLAQQQVSFDFWLDVIDLPQARAAQITAYANLLGRPLLDPEEEAILIAAIIEMALINCTHVIAIMTPNTAGSQWVPYEYGHLEERPLLHAGMEPITSWHDPAVLLPPSLPEYQHLAPILVNEASICGWLSSEKAPFTGCVYGPLRTWSGVVPDQLSTR